MSDPAKTKPANGGFCGAGRDQRLNPVGTSRRGEPVNSWRGRPILYSGSASISLSWAIQPTVRATGIFALARTVGWIAQLNEMLADPEYKIGRPRQLFTGSPRRDVPTSFKR